MLRQPPVLFALVLRRVVARQAVVASGKGPLFPAFVF